MDVLQLQTVEQSAPRDHQTSELFTEFKQGLYAALETYSNVHRGSGHNSLVSTQLYEKAREIVLEYLGLNKNKYTVIFCVPRRAELLKAQLNPQTYRSISSQEIGLPLGIWALAVDRRALHRGIQFQTGGGTARLVSPGWVIWAKAPDIFEAGTPMIINVIAFAKALRLIQQYGMEAFKAMTVDALSAQEILYHDELEHFTGHELLQELRQTLIGRHVRVPTLEGTKPFINLDNAASTPTFEAIWDAVWQTWMQPRPVQQEIVQEVKSICAGVLGAPLADYEVIFSSNTTESINLAAESLGHASRQGVEPVVLNTFLEHNSNELPWGRIPGVSMIRLPVDEEGFVDLNEMELLLQEYNQKGQYGKKRIKLVAVSGASNVLGVFNNLSEISRIAHRYGAHLLVDAAQMVAHRKVEMEKWGIDYLAFSAHKAYAPFGSGVLLVRKGLLNIHPAELEQIAASGEENVGGIAALGKALVLLQRIGLDVIQAEERALTRQALQGLAHIPHLKIYGIKDPDSPRFAQKGGVIPFNLNNTMPSRIAKELAEQGGIGVRSGCHCAHLLIKRLLHIPPLLQLFQGLILILFPRMSLPGVMRVSLGIENTAEDVDALIRAMDKIAAQLAAEKSSSLSLPRTDTQQKIEDFARNMEQRVYS